MPEYLIAVIAGVAISAFAKPLGDLLKAVRRRMTVKTGQSVVITEKIDERVRPVSGVELLLEQEDGTYKVAAHGQLDAEMVKDIIQEIDDSDVDTPSSESDSQ